MKIWQCKIQKPAVELVVTAKTKKEAKDHVHQLYGKSIVVVDVKEVKKSKFMVGSSSTLRYKLSNRARR